MKQKVVERIEALGYIAKRTTVVKNGVEFEGVIVKEEKEAVVAPIIYFKPDFEDVDEETNRIIETYKSHRNPELDVKRLLQIETIADNIRVGFQRAGSEPVVKQNTIFEGIEAYLYMLVDLGDSDSIASLKIKEGLLNDKEIKEEDAWNLALLNTNIETEITSLPDYLSDMLDIQGMKTQFPEMRNMYVVSNKKHFRGAACINDIEALIKLADKAGTKDFIALPSSIHEWILVPESECGMSEWVSQMVRDINEEQVPQDEWLGDRAYKIHIDKEVSVG